MFSHKKKATLSLFHLPQTEREDKGGAVGFFVFLPNAPPTFFFFSSEKTSIGIITILFVLCGVLFIQTSYFAFFKLNTNLIQILKGGTW